MQIRMILITLLLMATVVVSAQGLKTTIDEDRKAELRKTLALDYSLPDFPKLGFIKKDSSKKGFAEYLADVFPYLEATNIQRGFNSRGGYTDPNATRRIINDMVSEFEEVSDLINGG